MAASATNGVWRDVPCAASVDAGTGARFVGNTIRTSKYTVLTFLPLNLFEQLQKAANAYFLLISLLMFVGRRTGLFATSVEAITTLGPLVLMMAASALLAAADDYRRHQADHRTNRQKARAIRMGGKHRVYLDTVIWDDVKVGDILVLKGEDDLPADIVPLACSGGDGICYVSTANLDGETNLKIKAAAPAAQAYLCPDDGDQAGNAQAPPLLNQAVDRLASLHAVVQSEPPSKSIHSFTGSLRLGLGDEARPTPLGADNLLLRGTQLKNTAWCFGVVVYTGQETRMAKNSSKTPMKLANLERVVNRVMLVVLGTQALLALLSDLMYCLSKPTFWKYWYLFPDSTGKASIILPDWLGYWFTFFILYCNLMPISLYAAMEVCNFAQAYFIKSDLGMYDEEQDCPALVRSTNLCHELGQVSYIFSDKTGTLTQNVMDLKRMSIGDLIYGEVTESRGFSAAPDVRSARAFGARAADAIDAFLEILAVAHTVMVTEDQWGTKKYEAESPDEGALVEAVRELGWNLKSRAGHTLCVEVDHRGGSAKSAREYTVLAVNAFTSARKRMSTVVRNPSGEIWVLVKGADNVMLDRSASSAPSLPAHLTELAQEGLRTLVLGRRRLSTQEYEAWHSEFEKAQTAQSNREGLLAAVAEKLETNLELVGATGIEDKLQVGVGDTISRLRAAGIKLWVLTGDKLETARNIGYSTKVLSDRMEVLVLDSPPNTGADALRKELSVMMSAASSASDEGREVALMVTGASLELVADFSLNAPFLEVAMRCKVVIACRVSPLQKAWMVRLVRTGISPQPVTLSIGDGANDVPMIQEAQVGVGISGREGRQAVNAADFAICQFHFLQRLLLVHGRLNYRRMCKFILYSFWKNAVLTLLLFYYTFISGFSGTSMFEGMVWTSFNVILFWPIIATGVFDRDVSDQQALNNALLYQNGRLGLDLNLKRMVEMLLSALVHSLILFMVMMLAFDKMDTMHANDYYSFGTSVFTWLVFAMNYRVIFVTSTINIVFVAALASSFGVYILFLAVYCRSEWLSPWMYNVDVEMMQEPLFWIGLLAVPALAIMVDSFKALLILEFLPDRRGLALERVKVEEGPPASASASASASARSPKTAPARSAASDPGLAICPEDVEMTMGDDAARQMMRSQSSRLASSFAFDHPGSGPRRINFKRNPSAGDTSLMDVPQPPGAPAQHDPERGQSPRAARRRRPNASQFAQQTLPHIQNKVHWRGILRAAIATGTALTALGAIVMRMSDSVAQFTIQYDGVPRRPVDSLKHEMFHQPCPVVPGGTNSCTFDLRVPVDLEPPIIVTYEVSPFYQNYYSYQTSVIFEQLTGHDVSPEVIRDKCAHKPSRLTPGGDAIYPCGLIATSVFNDTIEFLQVKIDSEDERMIWTSDFDRFQNPPDYLERPRTSWLYERYPTVTDRARGVKSRRFVDWMFPSFFGHVRNMYGFVNEPLRQGRTLTVRLNASFPVAAMGAEKRIVVSTRNGLGGRHSMLAYALVTAGLACFKMACTVCVIQRQCPRRAGHARFPLLMSSADQDSDEPSQESRGADTERSRPPPSAAPSTPGARVAGGSPGGPAQTLQQELILGRGMLSL